MGSDLHIHNTRIWTADRERPEAESITIRDGLIVSLNTPSPDTSPKTIDAGGCVIIPGLIDAHTHLLMGGLSMSELDLSGVQSREAFEAAIAERHAELAPGKWLIASGWSNENWPGREFPDKSWLQAAGDRPVVCRRVDIHAALVNDVVLEMIDCSEDPKGGLIQRDAHGAPTGLMIEAAARDLVNPLLPGVSVADKQSAIRKAMAHHHALGITTVMSMEDAHDVEEVYLPMRDQLTLRLRVTLMERAWPMTFTYGSEFPNDPMLAVIGYKAFADGTLGSRTARMLVDYDDDPGNRGMLVELTRDGHLQEWARAVAKAGLSPSIHAIGDEAVRVVLDAIAGIDAKHRPRIEHAQQIDPEDIPRFQGVIASMQPLHKADDARYVTRRLGKNRQKGFFAFRELLEAGAILAFGSDWPVVSCDPLLGIRCAVTGLSLDEEVFTPEHNITIEEALRAYTADAAYAIGGDDIGVLKPGMRGDLVMLDTDLMPLEWNPGILGGAGGRVLMTAVSGEVRYDARKIS